MSLPAEPVALPPSARALDAARRITIVRQQVERFTRIAKAQVMEAAWEIREEIPERDAFDAFVAGHTPVEPERGWVMAQAWGVARAKRELRELVRDDPDSALEFVGALVESSVAEGVDDVDEIGREMVAFYTLPPRTRDKRLRNLLTVSKDVEAGKHPGDAEYIEQLTRERDEAVQALKDGNGVESLSAHPVRQLNDAAKELLGVESQVAALAEKIEGLCKRAAVSEALHRRLVAAGDLMIGNTERIIAAAMGEADEA